MAQIQAEAEAKEREEAEKEEQLRSLQEQADLARDQERYMEQFIAQKRQLEQLAREGAIHFKPDGSLGAGEAPGE